MIRTAPTRSNVAAHVRSCQWIAGGPLGVCPGALCRREPCLAGRRLVARRGFGSEVPELAPGLSPFVVVRGLTIGEEPVVLQRVLVLETSQGHLAGEDGGVQGKHLRAE